MEGYLILTYSTCDVQKISTILLTQSQNIRNPCSQSHLFWKIRILDSATNDQGSLTTHIQRPICLHVFLSRMSGRVSLRNQACIQGWTVMLRAAGLSGAFTAVRARQVLSWNFEQAPVVFKSYHVFASIWVGVDNSVQGGARLVDVLLVLSPYQKQRRCALR